MTLVTVEILTSCDETVALLLRRRQKPVSRIFKEESFFFFHYFLLFFCTAEIINLDPPRSPWLRFPVSNGVKEQREKNATSPDGAQLFALARSNSRLQTQAYFSG